MELKIKMTHMELYAALLDERIDAYGAPYAAPLQKTDGIRSIERNGIIFLFRKSRN